ncbi:hypothetical protein RCH33_319 [Flavobacterium daejeonense]|nr:hypothetical protein RCH33_319 [Flavobacterium daejeonense]
MKIRKKAMLTLVINMLLGLKLKYSKVISNIKTISPRNKK